jgi:hypothetical protein
MMQNARMEHRMASFISVDMKKCNSIEKLNKTMLTRKTVLQTFGIRHRSVNTVGKKQYVRESDTLTGCECTEMCTIPVHSSTRSYPWN